MRATGMGFVGGVFLPKRQEVNSCPRSNFFLMYEKKVGLNYGL